MKILIKYYDQSGKLRILKDKNKKVGSIIKFKILRKGREFPCCDFEGRCTNITYAEVYPCAMKNNRRKGWSYLCRKHYFDEQKLLKWKLPACLKVEW